MAKRVLIAEDERDVVDIMTAFLKLDGYEIEAVYNGKDALERVHAAPPDILLLDEMMPYVSGNDVAKKLKSDERFRHIPIIMVTARYHKDDKINSLVNAGVDDYITKPFDPDELRARVKSMLRIKELTDSKEEANKQITELYEKASRVSEARKKVIDEALLELPLALIFTDRDGNIYEWNRYLTEIISGDLPAIRGKNITVIFPGLSAAAAGRPKEKQFLEYFDDVNGKLNLEINGFLAGESVIYVIRDNTRYRSLLNIKEILTQVFDKKEFYGDFFKKILTEIRNYVFAEGGRIYIYDDENVYTGEIGDTSKMDSIDLKKNALNVKKIMYLKTDDMQGSEIENMLVVPVMGREKKIGLIVLYNCRGIGREISGKIDMIEFTVNLVSMFYENIMLTNRLNRENILIRSLISIAKIINSTLEYNTLIRMLAEVVSRFSDTDKIAIFIFERVSKELELAHFTGFSKDLAAKYNVSRINREELMADEGGHTDEDVIALLEKNPKMHHFEGQQPGSMRFMPLKVQNKLVGFILIRDMKASAMHIEMLTLLSEYAAKAIENAFLFEQVVKQNEQLMQATDILRKTEARLIASEQLAALGKFAAAVAHEIRTPLTIMLGGIQNIKSVTPEEQDTILHSLETKIIDIDHILKEMMTLAKPVTLEPEVFDIKNPVEDTLNFVKNKAKMHKVEVEVVWGHSAQVNADRIQTEKILLNLFVNALDSMREGGRLHVKTYDSGDYVAVSVSDTGSGVPENIKDKIFDPFFTTKKHGTGLGLYNVKRILELSGGNINFISSQTGTTFEIKLTAFHPL